MHSHIIAFSSRWAKVPPGLGGSDPQGVNMLTGRREPSNAPVPVDIEK